MALLLIIIAPNGHILANIAIVSQFSLAIDLSSKGLPGQLRHFQPCRTRDQPPLPCRKGTKRIPFPHRRVGDAKICSRVHMWTELVNVDCPSTHGRIFLVSERCHLELTRTVLSAWTVATSHGEKSLSKAVKDGVERVVGCWLQRCNQHLLRERRHDRYTAASEGDWGNPQSPRLHPQQERQVGTMNTADIGHSGTDMPATALMLSTISAGRRPGRRRKQSRAGCRRRAPEHDPLSKRDPIDVGW